METTQIPAIHDAAVAAAMWWARYITGVGTKNDGGDPMAAMMSFLADPGPNAEDAEKVQEFIDFLTARIESNAEWDEKRGDIPHVMLSTDYSPEGALSDALDALQIRRAAFPWKTLMTITPTFVGVREGYRARERAVWGERECGECKPYLRSEARDDGHGFKSSISIYGDATGKLLAWHDNSDARRSFDIDDDRRFTTPLGRHEITDEPCPTCDGAKVLRAPKLVDGTNH